jgi:hypothetical protein
LSFFLRYADQKFSEAKKKLAAAGSGLRKIGNCEFQASNIHPFLAQLVRAGDEL